MNPMSLPLWSQYLLIALAVAVSAVVVMKKQFPAATRWLRTRLALPLLAEQRPGWMRALGRWLAPPANAAGGACGGCSSCGPSTPKRH